MLGKNNKNNSLRFIAVLMVFAAGILAILGTNGNGNGGGGGAIARAQILTFDYDLQNLGNATGVAAELTSGARSIGEFMPAAPCVFIADFSVATTPEFNLNG